LVKLFLCDHIKPRRYLILSCTCFIWCGKLH